MYIGRYYHKLDEKNRFSLPISFRKKLGKKCVITKGLDGCLYIFDQEKWQKTLSEIENLKFTKQKNRDYIRLLTNEAEELEIDAQGRVLVSLGLKEQAKLVRDIVVVGSLDHIEVWNQAEYHEYLKRIQDNAEAIAEAVDTETNI